MLRSIKRSLSGNLSPPRVRFAPENKTVQSPSPATGAEGGSTFSVSMEGDTYEASTMGGDTISSSSSADTTFVPTDGDDPPGCIKEDSVDFAGVASESYRAIAMSAWLVSETVSAIGTEIWHCGFDSSLNTDTRRRATSDGKWDNSNNNLGNTEKGAQDDSSLASYPPSRQRRRKRPFGFFGRANRTRKNRQDSDLPTTVTTTPNQPPLLVKKVPPKTPATPKTTIVCTTRMQPDTTIHTKSRDHQSPAAPRAKKLFTACFVKRPAVDEDHYDDDHGTVHSRYRHDHEDLQLMGTSSVYTIRMSRVPTQEYESL